MASQSHLPFGGIECEEITPGDHVFRARAGQLRVALMGADWVPNRCPPPPTVELIYLHPPVDFPLEWRGAGAGYAVTLPVPALSRLPNVAAVMPFFEVWQPPRAIVVPTAELLGPLHSFLSVMYRGLTGGFDNDNLDLSASLALTNCSAFLLALRHLVYHYVPHNPESQPRRLAARYAELVERHYTERGDLTFYIKELRVTRDTLSRVCQQILGTGAKEFLQSRRFREADALLKNSQFSVKEIAYRVGFEDHAYFTRVFKEWSGMTPSEFRLMP